MSKQTDDGEDTVAMLLELAGPRADIPADLERRVHANVRGEWRMATSTRRAIRWAAPVALAATIVVAIALGLRSPELPLLPIGTIAVAADVSDHNGRSFKAGDVVYAGDTLATNANAGMGVLLNGDISLRIAAGTSIRLEQADEITLLSGQLYADSGDRIYRNRHLSVNTGNGTATDIGTQFSVSYVHGQTRVAVREGRVDVATAVTTTTALAGDRLTWQADGDVLVDQVATYDSSWQWAIALAPGFDNESRSLLELLKWAARETGRALEFSNDEVRLAAMGTDLIGPMSDLSPDEAIESAILATPQFQYRIDERSITITN